MELEWSLFLSHNERTICHWKRICFRGHNYFSLNVSHEAKGFSVNHGGDFNFSAQHGSVMAFI